jgi:hypothetical protein
MRRILLVLALSAMMATMLVSAGPAFAQGGCKEFGQAVRAAAQAPGPFGQLVKEAAPVNDEFKAAKEVLCA